MPHSLYGLGWLIAGLIPVILSAQATSSLRSYRIASYAGSNHVGDGGRALSAQLSSVEGLAVDAAGNLYIADNLDHRVRKVDPAGYIGTVAGNGSAGLGPESGASAGSLLNSPYGIAVDAAGNLYIADFGNARVRRVSREGTVRTIAGGGTSRIAGEGTDALGARLLGPRNLAVDAAGNLYISDYSDHRVYRVTPGGGIAVVAGTGAPGYSGDGAAASTQLNFPAGLTVDSLGVLYIADSANKLVRRVQAGQMTTILGGKSSTLQLGAPTGLALDPAGNLYVADSFQNRVFCRTSGGGISVIAGSDPELTAPPRDVAIDSAGNLFIAGGRQVLRRNAVTNPAPYAGDGSFGEAQENVAALASYLAGPIGVALDEAGGVYVVEESARRVRRIDYAGIISTVAGGGSTTTLGDGGPATAARLLDPVGIAVDSWGGIRIADYLGNRVRGVTTGGIAFTAAGDGTVGSNGDGGPAQSARVNHPRGLAYDREGNLYIADSLNHRIRKIGANGFIATVAGSGVRGYSGDGAGARQAHLNTPLGVFVDREGSVLIADSGNHVIRKVTAGGVITTIAGSGARGFGGDGGPAVLAAFSSPSAVVADDGGNLFIADTFNQRIRRVSVDGIVTTIAGDGASGLAGDGGAATQARFRNPASLAIDGGGRIFVADLDNNRIRLLTPLAAPLPPAELISELVVMNAASFRSGPVAPGQLISIFGEAITGGTATVRVNGKAATVFAAVAGQLNSQIPAGAAGSDDVDIEVLLDGGLRARALVPLAASAPGLFTVLRGVGQIIAVQEDGTLNGADSPAARDSVIVIYATGEGETEADGKTKLPVLLKIGNSFAEILYAGVAPGFQGLMQINAKLPGIFTPPGIQTVTLLVGGNASQTGVTIVLR